MIREKMLQQKLFHRFIHAILIANQLLGLWPYNQNFDDRSFKRSRMFYIYSTGLFTVINVGYFFYFQNLYTFYLLIFKSSGARITIMYGVVCMSIITLLAYPIQLTSLTGLNGIFVKSKYLMQNLNAAMAMEEVNYSKELLQFATKTFVISALQIYLCIVKLSHDPTSMIFGFIMPELIITVMSTSLYGILLIVYIYLKQMNQTIYNITDSAVELQDSDKKCLEKMETFCRLSDRLNELAIYRYRICDLMREICGIFSFHVNGWIVHRVCITFIQLFVIYIMIVMVVLQNVKGHRSTLYITVVEVLITVADLLLFTKACNDVHNELRMSGHKLYKVNIISSMSDKSYTRSLELLSLQIIQFKLDLSGNGMYNIDFKLMFSIFTFVVATWLILIQFEVTEWQKTQPPH